MPQLTILIGVLLTIIGVGGYLLGGENRSETALIPAGFGAVLVICGFIGLRNENARKHAMHAAVVIALLGAVFSLIPLFTRILNPDVETSLLSKLSVFGTIAVCVWLVVAGIMSFVRARRARTAAGDV